MNWIPFIIGLVLGVPLGWTLLFLLMAAVERDMNKRPPTKDEWKVM